MKKIQIEIGKLFTAIESFENTKIETNKEYFQNTEINILDEKLDFIKINGFYKKRDGITTIKFNDNSIMRVANGHNICVDLATEKCMKASELKVGTKIPLNNNEYLTISDINSNGEMEDVFDLEVNSESHLYSTSNGIVHHNTLLAVQAALDAFFNRDIEKIYITRPTVSKEEIGYLPGNIKEKMDPWLEPIYENIDMCYGSTKDKKQKIKDMLSDEDIKISPVAFMRGKTKTESYIIVDECQNITREQMMMIVTRLGKGSKLIFCGDANQIDLKRKDTSGLKYLIDCGKDIDGFDTFELKTNHRHPIVDKFIEKFES